jgi:hypothetical protein
MKLRVAVVVAVIAVIAAPPAAAEIAQKSGRTVGQAVQQLKRFAETRERAVRPNVITYNEAAFVFMFPGAGNVEGANNTHFRSDVTLANFGNAPVLVEVWWLPQGTNNCDAVTTILTLEPGWRHFNDFVGTTLGRTGLGTLVFMAITEDDDIDDTALLDGVSRIWTPVATGQGTTSQQFPAVWFFDLVPGVPAYTIGLRQDAGFRTNAGVVNLDEVARSWRLEVHPSMGTRPADLILNVPGCSMMQTNLPAGNFGPLALRWDPIDTEEWWSAFGSSTDNFTGDGWIVQANHGLSFQDGF